MNDRTILTISVRSVHFSAYIPKNGEPKNLAPYLLEAAKQQLGSRRFDSGDVLADFIASFKGKARVRLVANERLVLSEADFLVTAFYNTVNDQWWVTVRRVASGTLGGVIFDDSLAAFQKYPGDLGGLEDAISKIVAFTYKGGSRPGKKRIVRVENIEPAAGKSFLVRGTDLEKLLETGSTTESYRNYRSEDIQGDILIIN